MKDPRDKNEWADGNCASLYLRSYQGKISEAIQKIPAEVVDSALFRLREAQRHGCTIFSVGNGGSCSIAGHLCCDWMKGTFIEGQPPLKVHSLVENSALLTALANDWGYEFCFSEQIKMLGQKGDVLVAISSSGNSPNVINAAVAAREKKMEVIAMTGFDGGKLREVSDINLYVPLSNYGMVEDCHQILMHVLSQFLFLRREIGESQIFSTKREKRREANPIIRPE